MKRSILSLLASATLLTACSLAELHPGYENMNLQKSNDVTRIYDADGNYMGMINEGSGRVFDRNGNYIGRINR